MNLAGQRRHVRVTALYRFAKLTGVKHLRSKLSDLCMEAGVKGTILLAEEGVNGTVAGADDAVGQVVGEIRSWPGCSELRLRDAWAAEQPFHRMKIRIKREIVTMGEPRIDPLSDVGHYVAPGKWNALLADPNTILIDTRNEYEVAVGSFAGAINPHTESFRDFPAWFRAHREAIFAAKERPKVAMFCTGGIRCEKATAFLKGEGIDAVFHLEGGVLGYLDSVPPEESRWEGECFVFDERVAVSHGLQPGTHVLCRGCRMPVSADDRASPLYVDGVSCPACHDLRDARQRAGYRERHRQTGLAAARGQSHVGARPERRAYDADNRSDR